MTIQQVLTEGEAEEEDIEDVVLLDEEENEDAGDPKEAAAAASEDFEEDEGVADVDPAQSRFLANFGLAEGVIESGWERIKKEIFDKLVADADPLFAGGEAQAAEYQLGLLKNLMQRSTLVFDADPLAFYRTTNLQAIAPIVPVIKMLLSLPASESDCERAFSWSGNILTKTRNRLGASTLEMVMILYDTIKNFSLPDFEAFIGRLEEALLKAEAGGDW